MRLGRVDAHQRQQRERECREVREDLAAPGAGLLGGDALVDEPPGSDVVATQHGGQGAGRGASDRCGLPLPDRLRQRGEHALCGVEVALENMHEGDLADMHLRPRCEAAAGVDGGFRRTRRVRRMAQTPGQGAVDVPCRQSGKNVHSEGRRQEAPFIHGGFVADQAIEIAEVAGHDVAAKQHLVDVRVRADVPAGVLERFENPA